MGSTGADEGEGSGADCFTAAGDEATFGISTGGEFGADACFPSLPYGCGSRYQSAPKTANGALNRARRPSCHFFERLAGLTLQPSLAAADFTFANIIYVFVTGSWSRRVMITSLFHS